MVNGCELQGGDAHGRTYVPDLSVVRDSKDCYCQEFVVCKLPLLLTLPIFTLLWDSYRVGCRVQRAVITIVYFVRAYARIAQTVACSIQCRGYVNTKRKIALTINLFKQASMHQFLYSGLRCCMLHV